VGDSRWQSVARFAGSMRHISLNPFPSDLLTYLFFLKSSASGAASRPWDYAPDARCHFL